MGAHEFGRDELLGPPVHLLALEGIDVVGGPHPVGVLQDPEVDPGAAGGAGLDLQVREPLLELGHQPVGRQGLGVHPGASVGVGAGLEQVAVVVPLEVGDRVLVQESHHLVAHVRVGLRHTQIEHLLPAGLDGQAPAGAHDPLGVGAGHIGVGVDHLGLEPQAEFHAEVVDVVDQRGQALRPHLGGDHPVAQSGVVVAAGAEPPVVEHVALHAGGGRPVGQGRELLEAVVEVDGLPHVQRHRTGPGGVLGAGPEPVVEAPGLLVQPPPVHAVQPRGGVALALSERDLARQQQLGAAQHLLAVVEPFRPRAVVAGEPGVQAPDLAVGEAEARFAHGQDVGGVGAGAALASFPEVRAHGELAPLGGPFLAPVPCEVQDLLRVGGQGEHEAQLLDAVGTRGGVRQRGAGPQQARGRELQLDRHAQACAGVLRRHEQAGRAGAHQGAVGEDLLRFHRIQPGLREVQQRGPRGAVPVTRQSWPAAPAGVQTPEHVRAHRQVLPVGRAVGHRGLDEHGGLLGVEAGQCGAPVHHGGQLGLGEVDQDRHSPAREVDPARSGGIEGGGRLEGRSSHVGSWALIGVVGSGTRSQWWIDVVHVIVEATESNINPVEKNIRMFVLWGMSPIRGLDGPLPSQEAP